MTSRCTTASNDHPNRLWNNDNDGDMSGDSLCAVTETTRGQGHFLTAKGCLERERTCVLDLRGLQDFASLRSQALAADLRVGETGWNGAGLEMTPI